MKSNRKYILPFLALGLTMASCSDFLDKEPLDQGTDAIMFKSPEQFDQAEQMKMEGGGRQIRKDCLHPLLVPCS